MAATATLEFPQTVRLPLFSKLAAAATITAALLVLLGWATGVEGLIRLFPSMVVMNPVTAVTFVMAGVALCRIAKKIPARPGWHPDPLGVGLALIVTAVGVLAVLDHAVGLHFHIDQVLAGVTANSDIPSEMAPNTALEFLLCGVSLLLMDVESRRRFRPAQGLALVMGLIALMALIGYGYRVVALYRVGAANPMSLSAAACFALLTVGLLSARPNHGFMHVITSRTTGGAMARRLLPMAILVPWAMGMVLLLGEQSGYYPRQFAVSIFGTASIVVFTGLIWWNAKLLHLADIERLRTQSRLSAQHNSTRVLAESGTLSEAMPKLLQVVCESLNWRLGVLWTLDPHRQALHCSEIWRSSGTDLHEIIGAIRAATVAKGEGLAGRVWACSHPLWVADTASATGAEHVPEAARAGLHGVCGFPIWQGQDFFGVLELFSGSVEPRNEALVEMLSSVTTQAGLFVERVRAEEQLRQTSANLQRSNTELQQFAYVASHDLFEPLRMVTSYLQLLSHKYHDRLDQQATEFIDLAIDGARRMDALIRALLAYSRLDHKGRSFESTECDQVFNAAVANLKVAIEESGAVITRGPLPRVLADQVQLTQVFQNLIGNAIKFRGTQPPRIEVMAERADREWRFSFRDNGIGIDPKHFERIFVLFQRLHTRQEYAGTGMGLAICKKIIQRHGGNIWVESQPGRGATFIFTLPVLPERSNWPKTAETGTPYTRDSIPAGVAPFGAPSRAWPKPALRQRTSG